MNDNTSIIRANGTDIPELLAFARENFIQTYAHKNTPENMAQYLKQSFTIGAFTDEFNVTGSNFYLLENTGEIVGYYKLNLGIAQTEPHYPGSAEIERIYVAGKLKGQGLGRKMINHAVKEATKANATYLWLGVWEENPDAISFYEKLGFEAIDTHVFQLGDDAQTDIIMKLPV